MAGVLMSKVSLELVPRDEEVLRGELAQAKKYEGKIDLINIPDLLRLPVRSWEGAAIAGKTFPASSVPNYPSGDGNFFFFFPQGAWLPSQELINHRSPPGSQAF